MRNATRAQVIAALDCALCKKLVELHTDEPIHVHGPRTVDLGTRAAYGIDGLFGPSTKPYTHVCPDCGRVYRIDQLHNEYATTLVVDRDLVL